MHYKAKNCWAWSYYELFIKRFSHSFSFRAVKQKKWVNGLKFWFASRAKNMPFNILCPVLKDRQTDRKTDKVTTITLSCIRI